MSEEICPKCGAKHLSSLEQYTEPFRRDFWNCRKCNKALMTEMENGVITNISAVEDCGDKWDIKYFAEHNKVFKDIARNSLNKTIQSLIRATHTCRTYKDYFDFMNKLE